MVAGFSSPPVTDSGTKAKSLYNSEPVKTLREETLRRRFSKRGTDKICSSRQTPPSTYYPAGAGLRRSTEETGRARERAFSWMGLHLAGPAK